MIDRRADGFDQDWTLDGLGNFSSFNDDGTSQNRTVNEANQIQTITGGWVSPEYDAAGNMIFAPKSGDETTGLHFVRDAWNRLVAVYEDDGDGEYEPGAGDTLVAEYEFDGQNRRIEKTFADDTGVEYYYNRQWELLEERSVDDQGATTAVNQYVWSPRYIDSPIVRYHDANGDGDVLDVGDNTYYYTSDANHNVTATIDAATGDVVNRYVYTAYGEVTVYSPTWTSPAAATEDGPLYCGYWFDSETGNFQVRNRIFVTSVSTWDRTDPLGYGAGDANLYRYCGNRPAIGNDPLGVQWPASGSSNVGPDGILYPPGLGPQYGGSRPVQGPSPYPPGREPASPPLNGSSIVLMPDGSVRYVVDNQDRPLDTRVADYYGRTCPAVHPRPDAKKRGEVPTAPMDFPAQYAGAEAHYVFGAGFAVVRCRDADGCWHKFVYVKVCGGFAAGISAGVGVVTGMCGDGCNPEAFSGWFLEGTADVGGGVSGAIGLSDGPFYLPSDFSGVDSIGADLGGTAQVSLCRYWFLYEE